jgi:hypothetical protein
MTNPYMPIKNLFASIIDLNRPLPQQNPLNTMAQPANGLKELNLNKPDTFNGDWEKFRKFLQDVEVYMDINHEVVQHRPKEDCLCSVVHDC